MPVQFKAKDLIEVIELSSTDKFCVGWVILILFNISNKHR